MDGGEEAREDNWMAKDLTSGLSKVYAAAKQRIHLAARVAAGWGVFLMLLGVLNFAGLVAISPAPWEAAAGLSAILLSATATSLAIRPPVFTALLVILDVFAVSANLPILFEDGAPAQLVIACLRVVGAPFVLYAMVLGYMGAADVKSFRDGFRERDEWRATVNPMVLRVVVVSACTVAVLGGLVVWKNAVMAGLAKGVGNVPLEREADPESPRFAGGGMRRGAAQDEESKGAGGSARGESAPGKPGEVPESSIPVLSTAGLAGPSLRAAREGMAFGAKHDETGCLIEGLHRQDRCRDKWCGKHVRMFLRSCLPKSRPSEGFCEGVPGPMAVEEGTRWAETVCAGRNLGICREYYYGVQGHCHRPGVGNRR